MFDLIGPCKNCPFRNDKLNQKGWLGKDRAQDIFDNLKMGGFFPCHKTTRNDECEIDDNGDYHFELQPHHQLCAGALILLEKTGLADRIQYIQIAERLGFYDRSKLRIEASPVFDTEHEFTEWHNDN